MIDEFWLPLKERFLAARGHDAWVEHLETALAEARIARAHDEVLNRTNVVPLRVENAP